MVMYYYQLILFFKSFTNIFYFNFYLIIKQLIIQHLKTKINLKTSYSFYNL